MASGLVGKLQAPKINAHPSIDNLARVLVDAVKLTGISAAALAIVELTASAYNLMPKKGLDNLELGIGGNVSSGSELQAVLMAFAGGAGLFAGYTNRHIASITVYLATLSPDIVQFLNSTATDTDAIWVRMLAKTLLYGFCYSLPRYVKEKVAEI